MKTNLCKTCKYAECPLVPSWKVKDPDLLIVGEAPGADEVRAGIPFTGSSGQLMRKLLRETGFQLNRIAICNTCKCRPPENETPKEKEIALCSGQFLFQEIEEMKPRMILCVGAVASSAFNKDKRLKDVIGETREWHGIRMMATYHPAYLLYYPEAESKFRRDLRQVYNILYPVTYERRLVVVDTLEGLAEVKKWAGGKKLMGSDIETNKTLDPFDVNSRIICISFGDDQVSYSVSLDKDNDPVYMSEATAFVKALLGDPQVTHIFHRCWFDVKFLKSRGIEVARYTDTRLKSFLLNENRMEHGLKELASEHIGEYEYTIGEKDRHKFGLYNAEDSFMTYKLNRIFDKDMTIGLQNVLDKIILPAIPVLNEMMLTGMEIDIPYAKKLVKTTIKEREKAYHDLIKEHKIFRGINLNSGPQMQSVIFGALKEASVKKTKTGESLDEAVMNQFAYAGKDWAKKILKIRGFDKLLSTYIEKIPKMVNADGRIRTQFDPMGTVTGRLCVAGDTVLKTSCGTFCISDIDLTKHTECAVLTHEGRYRRILCKIYKGMEVMYEVRLENGCTIRCTQEHRFFTSAGWKSLRELEIGGSIYTTCDQSGRESLWQMVDHGREEFCAVGVEGCIDKSRNPSKVSNDLSRSGKLPKILQGQVRRFNEEDKECALCGQGLWKQERVPGTARLSDSQGSIGKEVGCGERYVDYCKRAKDKRILCPSKHATIRNWNRIQTASEDESGLGDFAGIGKVLPRNNRRGEAILPRATKVLRTLVRSIPEDISACLVHTGSGKGIFSAVGGQEDTKESYMLDYKQRGDVTVTGIAGEEHKTHKSFCAGWMQDSRLCISANETTCGGGRRCSQEAGSEKDRSSEGQVGEEERIQTNSNRSTHCRTKPAESCIYNRTSLVESITCVGVQGVWDIEVEEDHSYIAQGFINHNSSSSPNLQNIPRDNRVYRMFVASKDKVFFYFDFAQAELRIGCSIANELKMIDAFKNPVDKDGHKIDLHIRTAMMITGKKASEITKDERQLAKGVSFGLLYGQGAEGLKQYLFDKFGFDITLEEAERIRKIFFAHYTGLPLWYKRVQAELMTNHQIVYPTGRIRRFPQVGVLGKVPGDIFRQGVNAPVQGSAGDTVLFVMVHLHRLLAKRRMPSKFVNQVHDSVMLEMDNSKALIDDTKELVELVIKDVVQNDPMFRWIRVPLECEYKTGQNWGELPE